MTYAVGDAVRVLPSRPYKRDGYPATVVHVECDDEGAVRWVEVVGDPRGFRRSYHPERIVAMKEKRR